MGFHFGCTSAGSQNERAVNDLQNDGKQQLSARWGNPTLLKRSEIERSCPCIVSAVRKLSSHILRLPTKGFVIFCLKNWGINPQRKAFFMGSMIFLSMGWDGVPHFWHNPKNLQGTPHTVRPAVSRCYRIQLLRLYMSILDPTPDCRFDVFFNSKLHSCFLVSQLPLAVLPSSSRVSLSSACEKSTNRLAPQKRNLNA